MPAHASRRVAFARGICRAGGVHNGPDCLAVRHHHPPHVPELGPMCLEGGGPVVCGVCCLYGLCVHGSTAVDDAGGADGTQLGVRGQFAGGRHLLKKCRPQCDCGALAVSWCQWP